MQQQCTEMIDTYALPSKDCRAPRICICQVPAMMKPPWPRLGWIMMLAGCWVRANCRLANCHGTRLSLPEMTTRLFDGNSCGHSITSCQTNLRQKACTCTAEITDSKRIWFASPLHMRCWQEDTGVGEAVVLYRAQRIALQESAALRMMHAHVVVFCSTAAQAGLQRST